MMSKRERSRLEILSRVKQGVIAVSEAAELMSVSERQGWRIWARYQASGDRGLVHGLRGQRSNHRATTGHQRRVIARYRKYYLGWNEAHAAERRTAYCHGFSSANLTLINNGHCMKQLKKGP